MKLANRKLTKQQLEDCLKASAKSIDKYNPLIPAKLGAGILQVDSAIECSKDPLGFFSQQVGHINKPEGTFGVRGAGKYSWSIQPDGVVAAIALKNRPATKSNAEITIRNKETLYKGSLSKLPSELEIIGRQVSIELNASNESDDFEWSSEFESTVVDLEQRYCDGRLEVKEPEAGVVRIGDGSGKNNYAANSDCQWLIPHQSGKPIRIDFNNVNLADGDSVYIFSGSNTEQRNLLASLKGKQLPPALLVKGSSVLLWFLSDKKSEGRGFSAKVAWE